jgi:GT2 family glycosyltransferase
MAAALPLADAAPLLVPELVIAARDRAREPELPEATVERALATPVVPHLAGYDVIVLADDAAEPVAHLIAEFALHEHRVFVLHTGPRADRTPAAPGVTHVDVAAAGGDLIFALGELRREQTIEAAAVLLADSAEPALARYLRDRWGWRVVALDAGESPVRMGVGSRNGGVGPGSAGDAGVAPTPPLKSPPRRTSATPVGATQASPAAANRGVPYPEGRPSSATKANTADLRVAFDGLGAISDPGVLTLPPDAPWPAQWHTLDAAIRQTWPLASVVVLTHDNLAFTRLCLASVFANTEYPNYELIVVDNASTDGTVEELRRLAGEAAHLRVIENADNAGFGPGNNQGLAAARGEVLVLLNNDTVVPRGWLTRLARHLEDPAVGLVGPGTNRTCNEAQLNPPYQTYAEYQAVARDFGERYAGQRLPLRMLAMFCLAFRRDTWERLGPLDERYEVGMFEDEDYALRAKAARLEVVWTPEVYVHHAYHASIGKLLPSGEYMRLVNLNQGRFEEKWGICWERHRPVPEKPASK